MFRDVVFRFRALFRRKAIESELDEELRAHVLRETEKYMRAGLPREEATRRARLALGGVEQTKEDCREVRGVHLLETALQDIRYALRMLRKSPSLAAVAVEALLSISFSVLALLLGAIGLYGLMAYNVTQRTQEIGIRLALGASRGAVRWMVLRETLILTLVGMAIGVPCAIAATGLIKEHAVWAVAA